MTSPHRPQPARVPARILRALACLEVTGTERVLEVGCGLGHAAHYLLRTHPAMTYTAVDRSQHAVDATRARNADFAAQGRLRVVRAELADVTSAVGEPERFDLAFAVNVNSFWTKRAAREAAALAQQLRPAGALVLFFELPDPTRAAHVGERVLASLHAAAELRVAPASSEHGHLVIRARRRAVLSADTT